MATYQHYIRTDSRGRVISGFSTAFHAPQAGDICIARQAGYQFRLTPGGPENPPLCDDDAIALYQYANGAITPRTDADMHSDRAALPPPRLSSEQKIQASVMRAVGLWAQSADLPDDMALSIAEVYPVWEPQTAYPLGHRLRYLVDDNGDALLYDVMQAHTSQSAWPPDTTPALYKRLGFAGDTPLWVQPLGGLDAYRAGDMVSHNGQVWVSILDHNSYEPGVYGWEIK